jgi:hypothetical protein
MEKEVEGILIFCGIILIFAGAVLIPQMVKACRHPIDEDLENIFNEEARVTY